jgi:hypothetical protein
MYKIIICHSDESLKDYINVSFNNKVTSDTLVISNKTLVELAAKLYDKLKNNNTILLFSLETPIEKSKPNELKSVELIYHLRAVHRLLNPIVVVAMQSITAILRQQPKLTILSAQGVYFTDILTDFSFLSKMLSDYDRYCVKDLRKEYTAHFNSLIDLTKFRHQFANYWGLDKLIQHHNIVSSSDLKIEDETKINQSLKKSKTFWKIWI